MVAAAAAIAAHPSLWATAIVQGWRIARPNWWRRPPFLPVPDPEYLRFRLQTAYGDDGRFEPRDLVTYLRWCRSFPRSR